MYTSTHVMNGAVSAHSHTHLPAGGVREDADGVRAMLSRNPFSEGGRDVGFLQPPSRGGQSPEMERQTTPTTPTPHVVKTEGRGQKENLESHDPRTPKKGGKGTTPT